MKRFPNIAVALIVLVALGFYLCAYQVRFTETAVVTRFERPVDRAATVGLNFKWPTPIERVYKFDKRLRTYETQFTQLSTADQKPLTVSAFVNYRIVDAGRFLQAVGGEEGAETKTADLLKNAVSKVLKAHPMSALINIDPQRTRFQAIEDEIRAAVAPVAMKNYGIEIAAIGIARLGLPEKNTKEVAERMKAERRKVSEALLAEGDAEAKRIQDSAAAVASKITERARAYAKTIEGQGEAIAASYYDAFKRRPELATFLKQIESLRNQLSSGEVTVVFDAHEIPPFTLLLPEEPTPTTPEATSKAD